jgi:hypothetical protein
MNVRKKRKRKRKKAARIKQFSGCSDDEASMA